MSETEVKEIQNGYESPVYDKYVEDGKNRFPLRCLSCESKILEKQSGRFVIVEKELPHINASVPHTGDVPKELVKEFYHVENMFTFENIGFTYEVDNCKYLSCADCDAGPLGFYDIRTKHSYIAVSRVMHK